MPHYKGNDRQDIMVPVCLSEQLLPGTLEHAIDFSEAQVLWDDTDVVEVPARTEDEPRYLVVGKIAQRHWSAVITYRGEAVRIISVRRSRETEMEIYEGE